MAFLTSLTRRLTRPQRSSLRLILFGSISSQKCHNMRFICFTTNQNYLAPGISFLSCLFSLSCPSDQMKSPPPALTPRPYLYRSNNGVPAVWPTFRRKPEEFLLPDLFLDYVKLRGIQCLKSKSRVTFASKFWRS